MLLGLCNETTLPRLRGVGPMTPRTVLILCERAPVKVNLVPAMRKYVRYIPGERHTFKPIWECSYCGRRVQVVA